MVSSNRGTAAATTTTATTTTAAAAPPPESKRRRSLLSALFNSNASAANQPDESSRRRSSDRTEVIKEKKRGRHSCATAGERRPSVGAREGRNRAAQLVAQNDIVIVAPSEAKCVEVQISKSRSVAGSTSSLAAPRSGGGAGATKDPSVMKRIFNKMTRRSASGGDSPRGYLDELNEQMEIEKQRFQRLSGHAHEQHRNSMPVSLVAGQRQLAKSPSASSSLGSDSRLPKSAAASKCSSLSRGSSSLCASREQSPFKGRAWHANENYVPKMSGISELPGDWPQAAPAKSKTTGGQHQAANLQQQRQRQSAHQRRTSPMLEQFLQSHRIRFDSLSSLATNSTATSSSGASSCASLSCRLRRQRQAEKSAASHEQLRPAVPAVAQEAAGGLAALEPDQRLMRWQSLVAKSNAAKSASASTGGRAQEQCDSSDELEVSDWSSPALVCYCSDDTSCSSVELIWSRPQLVERRKSYRWQQERACNFQSSSVSPMRATPSRDASSSPANMGQQPAASSGSPIDCGASRLTPLMQQSGGGNRLTALGATQHAAVLELAKPSRARGRRIRDDSDSGDYVRLRSREQRRERRTRRREEPEAKRPELCQQSLARRATRQTPAPTSPSPGGQNCDWIPNPLFGPAELQPQLDSRRASCVDLVTTGAQATNQKVDLTAKLNRCKELLRRLGGGGQQPLEKGAEEDEGSQRGHTGGEPHSVACLDEHLDKFSLDERHLDDFPDETSSRLGSRNNHHRWSLRVSSPFAKAASGKRVADNGTAHLNHFKLNFDMRIRSNVSSFTSQLGEKLSDTGKRASVFADQLISSIKDTTKEQLVPLAIGIQPRDTLANTFASSPAPPSVVTGGGEAEHYGKSDANNNKAKMFSLIFMHQQQSGGGQPVITKQPKSTTNFSPGGNRGATSNCTTSERAPIAPMRRIASRASIHGLAKLESTTNSDTRKVVEQDQLVQGEEAKLQSKRWTSHESDHCKTVAISEPGRELDSRELSITPQRPARKIKRLRSRKLRKQANVAMLDESEEEERSNYNDSRKNRNLHYYRGHTTDQRKHVTY